MLMPPCPPPLLICCAPGVNVQPARTDTTTIETRTLVIFADLVSKRCATRARNRSEKLSP
jgi:hypothetical protein